MPQLGEKVFWTEERVIALEELARLASNLSNKEHLNWVEAIKRKPNLHKILDKKSPIQLSKSWGRYKKILNGYCYRAACWNKRDSDGLYCKKCRKEMSNLSMKSRNIKRQGFDIRYCKDILYKEFDKLSKKKLYDLLFKSLISVDYKTKEKILNKTLLNRLRQQS